MSDGHRRLHPTQDKYRMLVVTGSDDTLVGIYNGNLSLRDDLKTTQEEADVIMVQQMLVLAFAGASRIRVVSDDTDVFILLLHFYHAHQLSCNLSMESTTIGSRTVIDIGSIENQHQDIMKGLLACHALSGWSTVAKFTGIGKATALKILKSHSFPLLTIGNPEAAFGEVVEEATTFVAACYGIKDICFGSMSDVRYLVWSVKVGKKTTASPKLQVLPPTTESFMENVKRAHLQLAIWLSADQTNPPSLNPSEYGWIRDETSKCLPSVLLPPGKAAAPDELLKMIRCVYESEDPCATLRCKCAHAHLPCTIFCGCKVSAWQNALTPIVTNGDDIDVSTGTGDV